jgi:uncharacterized DUF497 family protein
LDIEWDENKRTNVLKTRGVDMVYAALIFEGPVLTKRDNRADYGEKRFISLGMVEDDCFVVIHTPRGTATRLITGWKGGQLEKDQYQAGITR